MVHRTRKYHITPKDTVHAMALALTKAGGDLCAGFSVEGGRLLALNDSFNPDAVHYHQEFTILLRGADGGYRQVESLTCTAMKSTEIEAILRDLLNGTYPRGVHDDEGSSGVIVAASQAQLLMALGLASEAEVDEPSLPDAERPIGMSPYLARELSKPALTIHLCDHCS